MKVNVNISGGILSFFYRFYRPIIETGRLYKVYAPLYRIDDKDNEFIINKSEMVEIYQKKLIKKYKIRSVNGDWMSKDEMKKFLLDIYDYATILINAADSLGRINKFFVEVVIAYLVLYGVVRSDEDYDDLDEIFNNQKFVTNYMNSIQKKFKEVRLDNNNRLFGIIDGKTCIIKLRRRFLRKVSDIIPVIREYGYELEVKEKDKDGSRIMSIGEFIDMSLSLYPKILSRYKGLTKTSSFKIFLLLGHLNETISSEDR